MKNRLRVATSYGSGSPDPYLISEIILLGPKA